MNKDLETLNSCILCGSGKNSLLDKDRWIMRCEACGHIYDNPRPTLAAIADYYSKEGSYDRRLDNEALLDRICKRQLRDVRKFKKSGSLLDVGAGIGQFMRFAGKYFQTTGTELSSEAVKVGQTRYGLDLKLGEVESIDFGDKKFDIITLSQVLEHVPFPGRTLRHCASLLNPGGIIYLSVPNEGRFSLRMVLPGILSFFKVKKFSAFSWAGFRKIDLSTMNEIHISHFSESTVKLYCRQIGLEIAGSGPEFLDPFLFASWPFQILRRIIFIVALILYKITGINMYNCFWVTARKP